MTATPTPTPAAAPTPAVPPEVASMALTVDPRSVSSLVAFKALLLRDVYVIRKNLKDFIPRGFVQPFLLVFVFTYVFPKVGQGVGGATAGPGASMFSTMLVAGVLGSVILYQGVQAVALPLVQDFGFTKEIEDRVLAPLPIEMVALEKIFSGALQCLVGALILFPIARFVPATPVDFDFNWPVLLTFAPLACFASSALGLTIGTAFDARTVPLLWGTVVIPLTFLGCIYYPWTSLEAIPWLRVLVLVNPLVYISEGFRAALTPVAHMPLFVIYPVMLAFTAFFMWRGIVGFKKRVLT